jgi:predicted phage terminase large subunit-like protein
MSQFDWDKLADGLSGEEARYALKLKKRLGGLETQKKRQDEFMPFVKHMWPDFIEGEHHKIFAKQLEAVAHGKSKRLIVNMPPRHTKSEFASVYFPAWMMGRNPKLKIIQATHTTELATGFGRKCKAVVNSPPFQESFPEVKISPESQAAGRWNTVDGGEYFAAGVGAAITGRGADLLIIDDPHSEQDALSSTSFEACYEWYTSGPRQRLQPGGSIVIVMTRWSTKDLTAEVLKMQSRKGADQWEVIEFPAIFEDDSVLWPGFWSRDELEGVKASLPVAKWSAQWLQKPTSDAASILKREWWKKWEDDDPPRCEYVLQSYDTAFLKSERADYSAITTWGIFYPDEDTGPNIILLNSEKGRWEFPTLKRKAQDHYNDYEPDMVLVEAKASGLPLSQELRNMGIPVINFSPGGRRSGQDKIARANASAPMFEAGLVWCPDTEWAEEVVEECASFPNGDNDDLVDSTTQAILRFREGGLVRHPEDYEDEESGPRQFEYY